MGKLWLTLYLMASPVLAMEGTDWGRKDDSPLMANARGLAKESALLEDVTRDVLNESAIGEQLVTAAQITDKAVCALNRIGKIINEMRMLSVQANNDAVDKISHSILNVTFTGARDSIIRIIARTMHQDKPIWCFGADFTFHVMDYIKGHPCCSLQISDLNPLMTPLYSCDVLTTPNARQAGAVIEILTNNIALEMEKLENSKKMIMELLEENVVNHQQAVARLNDQIAVIGDYLEVAKKLAPVQEK